MKKTMADMRTVLNEIKLTESEDLLKGMADVIALKDVGIDVLHFSTLIKLKEQVAALTLEDVIHTSPSLDFILENQYGDLIECENISSTAMSMDDFIRNMESGVTYYVYERVILMH